MKAFFRPNKWMENIVCSLCIICFLIPWVKWCTCRFNRDLSGVAPNAKQANLSVNLANWHPWIHIFHHTLLSFPGTMPSRVHSHRSYVWTKQESWIRTSKKTLNTSYAGINGKVGFMPEQRKSVEIILQAKHAIHHTELNPWQFKDRALVCHPAYNHTRC